MVQNIHSTHPAGWTMMHSCTTVRWAWRHHDGLLSKKMNPSSESLMLVQYLQCIPGHSLWWGAVIYFLSVATFFPSTSLVYVHFSSWFSIFSRITFVASAIESDGKLFVCVEKEREREREWRENRQRGTHLFELQKKLPKSLVFSQAADNRSTKMLFLAAQFIHRRLTIPILSKWKNKNQNTIFTQIFDCTTNMEKKKSVVR